MVTREHTYTHRKGYRRLHQEYVLVYLPNHPRSWKSTGEVYEHIVVWEEVHNQSVPDGWVIHHLNGIKDDNRPSNLVAIPRDEHHTGSGKLVQALRLKIRELEIENMMLKQGFGEG